MVVAVSAKDGRNADESLPPTQAALPDSGAAESDNEFVSNGGICFEKPRNAVQLGVACQRHVVEHVDKLVVRFPSCFNFEFLNWNLERMETSLGGEIGIGLRGQFMEWLFYLN